MVGKIKLFKMNLYSSFYLCETCLLTNRDETNKHLPHTYINLINVVYLLEDSEKFICILGVLQNNYGKYHLKKIICVWKNYL